MVKGRLFDKNMPDLINLIRNRKDQLGMSYEVSDCDIESMSEPVWTLSGLRWTGCAILNRADAAYEGTAIALAA